MAPGSFRRLVAVALAAVLAGFWPVPASGGPNASWSGRVFDAKRSAPRNSVVVGLLDDRGEWSARSEPTRADGGFVIAAAAPGTYRLAVEAPEGLFLLAQPLELRAGSNVPQAVTLQGAPQFRSQDHGFGKPGHEMSRWAKWVIAGSIGLVALFALAEVGKDEDQATPVN